MMMAVDCSNCRAQLQLPQGAQFIRCMVCQAITRIAKPPLPYAAAAAAAAPTTYPPHQYYSLVPPSAHGQKRAVICGISYLNSRNELKLEGCINDAKNMKYMLTNKFKFPESSILMLTEEENDTLRRPTKHNIIMAMKWLVQGCKAGDSLVFHFSGHGSQQKNNNGEELDGYDETLCPSDFETEGMIVDDEINAIIVQPLPHGVKLHAIIDTCHSGTVLDLPFLCRMNSRNGLYNWEDHRPRTGTSKGTNGGEVICFSGCDDDQTSIDTDTLSKGSSTGAMTYSFIRAIEGGHSTYGSILRSMQSTILANLLSTIGSSSVGVRMSQEPQLTANEEFDVYTKPFSL